MDKLDYVVERIEPWLTKYFSAGAQALSPLETIGVGVWMLDAQVNNGGFNLFYSSSAGDLAIQTVDALHAIGAHKTASLLAAANAEFPNSSPPKKQKTRERLFDKMESTLRFEALETEFYRGEEDRIALLARYLRAHPSED